MSKIDRSKIRRQIKSISVKKLIDDYIYRIDLDADYQREVIWSRKQQEELLDSIHQNIDIPKLYLAETPNNDQFDFECIDGKQRMVTLLNFLKPDPEDDNPLTLRVGGEKYTYKRLKRDVPHLAKKFENFQLTIVIYPELDDDFIREIFSRLQLGVRLNAGELLKMNLGAIRNFIYKEMSNDAPFLRHTKLSTKRFSRQFTLAQICINSFKLRATGDFVRARYDDLADFFKEQSNIEPNDKRLLQIKDVLNLMDKHFGKGAENISSRAVAVSAYLFVEALYSNNEVFFIPDFVKFYLSLLDEIKRNLALLSRYKSPQNPYILEEFQKYISQASVEPYSLRRRHLFLKKVFEYYRNPKTKGKIIGNK